MSDEKLTTYFAPAEREILEKIHSQAEQVINSSEFGKIYDAIPDIFMVLNSKRQVVFFNSRLQEFLGTDNTDKIYGRRPGELLNCIHHADNPGGCGTSEYCTMCGAVKAILCGLRGESVIQECRILTNDGTDALDIKVWASPIDINEERFVVFAVQDIGNEKRRDVLEKLFFHDVTNTVGALKGLTNLIKTSPNDIHEFKDILHNLTECLLEEITSQQQLLQAEKETLRLAITEVSSLDLLQTIREFYKNHFISEGKHIEISQNASNIIFNTDYTIIKRIISNMLKNALEATPENKKIILNSYESDEHVIISVNNPIVMPREVQLQLFQRHFSTKGDGRGLGTYSMKLFTEKFLKGEISFISNESDGTTFFAKFPKKTSF